MSSASASSRLLILLFTDLVGSTFLKAEKGDDVGGELIARHRDHVKQLAPANHGRIISWAGDGCFLALRDAQCGGPFCPQSSKGTWN